MKKILLFMGLLCAAQSTFAQINSPLGTNFSHRIFEKNKAFDALIPFESKDKNNSFDGPLAIEDYNVIGGSSILNKYYQFSYSPSGVLISKTNFDENIDPISRVIYNRDGNGNIVTIISQNFSVNWNFNSRTSYEFAQDRTTQIKWETYNSGLDIWELDEVVKFEYIGGFETPSFVTLLTSEDNISFTPETRVYYDYDNGNKPSVMEYQVYNDDFLTWVSQEKWLVSEWGPKEFKSDDILTNGSFNDLSTTDMTIEKYNQYSIYPKECNLLSGYDLLTQSFNYNYFISNSVYNSDEDRTYFKISEITAANDTLPSSEINNLYDPCYGFKQQLEGQYAGGAYVLNDGFNFAGESTPYLTSCYVTGYNVFVDFSAGNPTGTWEKRFEITHQNNLSVDEVPNQHFKLYPNPATNLITIEVANEMSGKVDVLDLNGSVLIAAKLNGINQTIDISSIPSGVYFLRLQTQNNFETQRFIKK